MTEDDLEDDTMFLKFYCREDGHLSVAMGYNLTDELDDKSKYYYMTLIHGIMAVLNVEPELFVNASAYAAFGAEMERQDLEQELEDSLKNKDLTNVSVLNFKGKLQ